MGEGPYKTPGNWLMESVRDCEDWMVVESSLFLIFENTGGGNFVLGYFGILHMFKHG